MQQSMTIPYDSASISDIIELKHFHKEKRARIYTDVPASPETVV